MELEVFPHIVADTFGECISTFLIRLRSEEDTKKKMKTKKIVVEEKKKTTLQTVQGNTSIAAANPKPKLTTAAKQKSTVHTKKNFQANSTVPSSRPSFTRRASASLEAAASMTLKERMAMYQKQSSVDADVAAGEEKFHDKEGKEASKGKNEEVEVDGDKDIAIEKLPDKDVEESKVQDDVEPVREQARAHEQQSTTSDTKKKKKKSLTSFFRKKK